MDIKKLRKILQRCIILDGSNALEYQNKFYLMKKIKDIFPMIPQKAIFESINFVNLSLASNPIYDKRYIDLLALKLYELL